MKLYALGFAALMIAAPATAQEALSVGGADFGRTTVEPPGQGLTLRVPITDSAVVSAFVVARTQSNRAYMLTGISQWVPWDGDLETLGTLQVTPADNALNFKLSNWPGEDVFLPCTFTVGYWANGVMKFGYITVDEP